MAHRKNFFPTLIIALLSWLGFILLIIFIPPSSPLILSTFYMILFLSLFLTLSLLLANTRRGFLIAIIILIFLFLRQLKTAGY